MDVDPQILSRKGVAPFAVRHGPPVSSAVSCSRTPDVFLLGHRLHVLWIHTASNPTAVIELKTYRNGSHKQLIKKPMRLIASLVVAASSVSALTTHTDPQPTPAHGLGENELP